MKQDFYSRLTDDTVLQWLDFARTSSLSLVTGCVKSRTWGVAAVSNSEQHSTSLKFNVVDIGGGSSCLYRWESSGPGHFKVGPSAPSASENQCVFLRGFKMSSRKSLRLMGGQNDEHVVPPPSPMTQVMTLPCCFIIVVIIYAPTPASPPIRCHKQIFIGEGVCVSGSTMAHVRSRFCQFTEARVAVTHDDDWLALIDEVGWRT